MVFTTLKISISMMLRHRGRRWIWRDTDGFFGSKQFSFALGAVS